MTRQIHGTAYALQAHSSGAVTNCVEAVVRRLGFRPAAGSVEAFFYQHFGERFFGACNLARLAELFRALGFEVAAVRYVDIDSAVADHPVGVIVDAKGEFVSLLRWSRRSVHIWQNSGRYQRCDPWTLMANWNGIALCVRTRPDTQRHYAQITAAHRSSRSRAAQQRLIGNLNARLFTRTRMSDLYRGHNEILKMVPWYLPDDSIQARAIIREARIARRIRDLGIPRLVGIDAASEQHRYLVLQAFEGSRLDDAKFPLSTELAGGIATQIAECLAALHVNGYVHRDISSRNIITDKRGEIRVIDLGSAFDLRCGADDPGLGSPYFMSPEQFACDRLSEKTDVFSFAIVLYLMLTGEHPFASVKSPAGSALELPYAADSTIGQSDLRSILDRTLSAVPARFRRLLRDCLQFDPYARPGLALVHQQLLRISP